MTRQILVANDLQLQDRQDEQADIGELHEIARSPGRDARRVSRRHLRWRRRHGGSRPAASAYRHGRWSGHGRGCGAAGRTGFAQRRRQPVDRDGHGRLVPVRLGAAGVAHRNAGEHPRRRGLFPNHRAGDHLFGWAAGARGLPRRIPAYFVHSGRGAGALPGQPATTGGGDRASHERPAGGGGHDGRQRPLRVRGATGRRVHRVSVEYGRLCLRCKDLHDDAVVGAGSSTRLHRRRGPLHRNRLAGRRPSGDPVLAAADCARCHDRGSGVEPRRRQPPPGRARVREQREDLWDPAFGGRHRVRRHRGRSGDEARDRDAFPARVRRRDRLGNGGIRGLRPGQPEPVRLVRAGSASRRVLPRHHGGDRCGSQAGLRRGTQRRRNPGGGAGGCGGELNEAARPAAAGGDDLGGPLVGRTPGEGTGPREGACAPAAGASPS